MPDGVRIRISSLLAVVMALPFFPENQRQLSLTLLECRWYTTGAMDALVPDDLEAGDGRKLSAVAYSALLDMILRGTIAAGGTGAARRAALLPSGLPAPPAS